MNEELLKIVDVLKNKKTICLLAPSFPIDFTFPEIIFDLRKMGFGKIVELTYAGKLINYKYIEILRDNPDKQYICPNCPAIVKYIETKHPDLVDKIIDVASPMVVMARFVKREFGEDYKTIFLGPCFVKKQEAKENEDCVDYALTFKEVCEIYSYLEEKGELKKIESTKRNLCVDKFYNDVTKIYPFGGGVAESMLNKEVLKKEEIIVCEGPQNLETSIEDFKNFKKFRFLDILFCYGGCLAGPGAISKETITQKKERVLDYKTKAKFFQSEDNYGKFVHAFGLDISRSGNKFSEQKVSKEE